MGYYTVYEIDDKSKSLDGIKAIFNDITGYNFKSLFEDGTDVKWYSHSEDMKYISTLFKDHVFQLKGMGEEFPDIWVEYFVNGKSVMYEVKIEYPELNKLQLK